MWHHRLEHPPPPLPRTLTYSHSKFYVFFSSISLYSGTLVNSIGFEWMLVGIAILCFLYAPLLTFLRAPPTKEEKKVGDTAIDGVCNNGMTLDSTDVIGVVANGGAQVPENYITKL